MDKDRDNKNDTDNKEIERLPFAWVFVAILIASVVFWVAIVKFVF